MPLNLLQQRLDNQCIAQHPLTRPADVVQWLGAVQSQDYAGAKWALGLRLHGATDSAIEQALDDGAILRTHVLRPTWHFVTPTDIRWMLTLTAPRVYALSAYYYRKSELDDAVFARSTTAIIAALQGGNQLTRVELAAVLARAGIATNGPDGGMRCGYILMHAELAGIVCSGARRGKQQTYALLAERAPQATTMERDEALAALATRYFTSHGPATLKDYIWWSGLSATDAKAGLDMVTSQLDHETVDDQTYWLGTARPPARDYATTAYLLPNYDEYTVGYTDRSAACDPQHRAKLDTAGQSLLTNNVVIDGRIAGTWKHTSSKGAMVITTTLFAPLTDPEHRALTAAATAYGIFLGMPVALA